MRKLILRIMLFFQGFTDRLALRLGYIPNAPRNVEERNLVAVVASLTKNLVWYNALYQVQTNTIKELLRVADKDKFSYAQVKAVRKAVNDNAKKQERVHKIVTNFAKAAGIKTAKGAIIMPTGTDQGVVAPDREIILPGGRHDH